jgi:replication factor C subunit 1
MFQFLCLLALWSAGGDRGGVADLIQTIKISRIPIICICNDKYSQKLRSLRSHVSGM